MTKLSKHASFLFADLPSIMMKARTGGDEYGDR